MNRRRQIRYPLRNPVLYLWEREGVPQRGHGWTQSVSEQGIYVSSRNCPSEGDSVDLVFKLASPSSLVSRGGLRMEMKGSVVRIDRDEIHDEVIGFAVARRDALAPLKKFSSWPPREVSSIIPSYLVRIN